MKKLNLFVLMLLCFTCFVSDVNADTITYDNDSEWNPWSVSITTDKITDADPSDEYEIHFNCYLSELGIVTEEVNVYGKMLHISNFYIPNYENDPPANDSYTFIELDDEETATIMLSMENLVLGTEYDVYYLNNGDEHNEYEIDEEHLGDTAVVVNEGGKLYVKFDASIVKTFLLAQKVSDEYKTKLAEVTTNGKYLLNAANPGEDTNFDFTAYYEILNEQNDEYKIDPVWIPNNDDKVYATIQFADLPHEKQIVECVYKYDSIDLKIQALLDEIANSITLDDNDFPRKIFAVEDLSYINYLYNLDNTDLDPVYYSVDLRNTLKGSNLIPYFSYRAGSDDPFNSVAFGFISLSYDGTLYPFQIHGGYQIKPIIYVASNTENNDDALMGAAKARIVEYLGIKSDEISIEVGGTRASVNDPEYPDYDVWEEYDTENLSDNYYKLTINGHSVNIVIEKNDEKAKNVEFITKDILTDIEISLDSGCIPLDTHISAKKVLEDSDLFKEILGILNKKEGIMVDLKLFSSSLNKYITKLDSGEFEVKIPITNKYKNKRLSAYYVDEDGNIEEYNAVIDDEGKYATFKTSHFSTYTLAEASDNPKTYDGIMNYVVLCIMSAIGLLVISLNMKKRFN